MAIQIWSNKTGEVFIRNFDQGVADSLGAVADPNNYILVNGKKQIDPCYKLDVDGESVPVYFSNPEPVFQKKVFPFLTINREDLSPALGRWMGGAQLEYKWGDPSTILNIGTVSGFTGGEAKYQAYPYDITYTLSAWHRYEGPAHRIIRKVLQAFPPVGRLVVYDSLNLMRSYEYYHEGTIVPLVELLDPASRAKGFALTIRVEGELDIQNPFSSTAVTGVDLNLYRLKK